MAAGVVNRSSCLERYATGIARQAVHVREVPPELAEEARRATLRRFTAFTDPLSRAEYVRVRAYFWGVVRRCSIRSRGDSLKDMRSLYVLMSVAEDLRAAGRSADQILAEIEVEYGREVPMQVLLRLRTALAA